MSDVRSAALTALARDLSGRLTTPADDAYEAERHAWNLSVEQRPVAIAHPADVDDLVRLLGAARDSGLRVAVQASGHGATELGDDALLVRPTAFDGLHIDAEARVARIGAGVRWRAVLEALEGTGLCAPAGTSRVVSAAGYLLGGGHAWLSRTTGLGAHSLVAATLVRPDGSVERVDDASDPDTMWALRGAGGAVGIITELELALVEAPELHQTSLSFAVDDGPAVLRALRDLQPDAPESLNVFVSSMRMPDAPQLPEAIRGRRWFGVEALATRDADLALLDALRQVATPTEDVASATTQAAMAAASREPEDPGPSRGSSTATGLLSDATIDALLAWHQEDAQAPLVGLSLRMLGGALDRPARPAFASLEGASWLSMGLAPLFPGAPAEPGDAALAGLQAQLAPDAVDRMIPTFLAAHETLERCGTGTDLARLRAIRDEADPDAVLHEGRLPR